MVKKLLIVNGIGFLSLIMLGIAFILLDGPIYFFIFFGLWFVYMIFLNYQAIIKDSDKLESLQDADKHHLFANEIVHLTSATKSIEFYRPIFEKYEVGNSIRDTYDLLSNNAYMNVDKATKWIECYDPISRPSHEYIHKLVTNSKTIVQKLNELNNLVLEVEDSVSDTDISFVDDMLSSLKEVLNDEEQ